MSNKHELSHFRLILEKRSSSLHSSPQVNCVSVFKIQAVPTSKLRTGIPSRCPGVPCRLHSPHTTSDQVSGMEVWGTDISLAHSWLQMCRQLREPAGRCRSGKYLIRSTPPTYSSCPGGSGYAPLQRPLLWPTGLSGTRNVRTPFNAVVPTAPTDTVGKHAKRGRCESKRNRTFSYHLFCHILFQEWAGFTLDAPSLFFTQVVQNSWKVGLVQIW